MYIRKWILNVDDLLVTNSNEIELKRFKANIMNEFEMVYFLRVEFMNTRSGVS